MIKYKKVKEISLKKLLELYHSVGWAKKAGIKGAKEIGKAHKNSQVVISAWNNNKLIGIVRGITDKMMHGLVAGLIVNPKYQKKGIGRKLFFQCIKTYPKVKWFTRSSKNADNFYKKIKLKKDKNSWYEYIK